MRGLRCVLAPRVGLEPTTFRLTAERSTIELPRNLQRRACGARQKYTNASCAMQHAEAHSLQVGDGRGDWLTRLTLALESYGYADAVFRRARSSMVEQGTHNPLVVGSNPTGPTRKDPMRRTTVGMRSKPEESNDPVRGSRHRMHFSPLVLAVVATVLIIAGFMVGRSALTAAGGRMEFVSSPEVQVGETARPTAGEDTAVASASAGMVEVPQLVGMRADEALVVLETAGFAVDVVDAGDAVDNPALRLVVTQRPAPATVLPVESTITIVAPPMSLSASGTVPVLAAKRKPTAVVCIDPGHQAHSDSKLEPIGPGAKTEKPRATGGSTGVVTGVPEHEIALQLSMNLKKRLEERGVKVVLTRTTNDVRLSNSQRAKIANRAESDLFVRIHCGVSTNPADSGIATFYPAKNRWTAKMVAPSRTAARKIEKALVRTTGATSAGASEQSGIAGFNWSAVPSVFVEVGYLSNETEDRLLSSPQHQDKVAEGIAQGVLEYVIAKRP